ncbi:Acetyl-CoA:oxalate CoA-transferase [Defluviimonas aquaemixtae]|uniref:Acetyl-CoA:oxalate CoA-transferase n=1 Tax=Albidovulum aquaemixtae TaxID=1542388 RepID=A0A2R8B4K8_9RHOB|nr:CaiB/BaiF CoA-transferase family protein [Defluviimonas aquaemixtae]SPH17443.1 Acetyl-CoA:oxalate CoA-transferase [Defluviimonas aquaemixtae]
MTGPLKGLRIVEIAGLGPTPFAAMMLADMGADVVRIERPGNRHLLGLDYDILNRSRGFVTLDLKAEVDRAAARRLIDAADGLIEGLRPGAMERLDLGPGDFPDNPRLVYGRMTGWGQAGPLARAAGHDINYIALSGALHAVGPSDRPIPPLNLLGDFGGGGIYLAFGMVCGFLEAARSGQGQVVDAAIIDGTAHLMAMIQAMAAGGKWTDRREANILDGAAPFYGTYRCKCGGFLAVGAIEPKFWAEFLERVGLDPAGLPDQMDEARWPEARRIVAERLAERTRDEWAALLEGTDACAAPVLKIAEAPQHPHNAARRTYITHEDVTQAAPAPRLSRTPGAIRPGSQTKPMDLGALLKEWGA